MMADPVVRATQAGTVRLRNDTIRTGAKLPATAAVFVCGTGEQIASFGLPEELRGLVRPWTPEDPEAGRAEAYVRNKGVNSSDRTQMQHGIFDAIGRKHHVTPLLNH